MSFTRSGPIVLCLLFVELFACAQAPKAPSRAKQAKAVVMVKPGCDPRGIPAMSYSPPTQVWRCLEGKWALDQKATEGLQDLEAQEYKRRQDLYWALRTRALTDTEMRAVEGLGLLLVVSPEVPFNEESKRRELNEALLQQFRIRHLARGGKP